MGGMGFINLTKTVTLVGMMGVGKTSIGRLLAKQLGVDFKDSDHEVEKAAAQSVADIYERYGEQVFKDTERRVITRLLDEEPHILSTGVEAFIDEVTQKVIKERSFSVWLEASIDTIYPRVARRSHRPQLEKGNKKEILMDLINRYNPVYRGADIHILCDGGAPEITAEKIISALEQKLRG